MHHSKRSDGATLLSLARVGYAGLSGLGMIAASLDASRGAALGSYTLIAGFASGLSVVAGFGFEKALARRRAAGLEVADFSRSFVFLRTLEFGLILVTAVIVDGAGTSGILLTGGALLCCSRVAYADLEAIWIATARRSAALAVALFGNGVITFCAIYYGSHVSAGQMLILSALGNVFGFLVLFLLGDWKVSRSPIGTIVREASGFGLSGVFAVIYGRVDLIVLAVAGTDLSTVAIYGVVTRIFDALSLVRGSIAQIEMRSLATSSAEDSGNLVWVLSKRAIKMASLLCVLALLAVGVMVRVPALQAWASNWKLFVLAALAIPAFWSHLPTTAFALSDSRSNRLFVGSVLSAVGASVTKVSMIHSFGVPGAIVAIGACELMSYFVFLSVYRIRGSWVRQAFVGGASLIPLATAIGLILV